MSPQSDNTGPRHTLNKLPYELLSSICPYLSSLDIHTLSQTSSLFRELYHPLLYTKCKVSDRSPFVIAPITHWLIPPKVFFMPSQYSWFPNEVVQVIKVDRDLDLPKINKELNFSVYPKLKSITLFSYNHGSPLVITDPFNLPSPDFVDDDDDEEDNGDDFHALVEFYMSTFDFLPIIQNNLTVHHMSHKRHIGTYYALDYTSVDVRSGITSLNVILTQDFPDYPRFFIDIAKNIATFPNLRNLKISSSDYGSPDALKTAIMSFDKLEKLENLMVKHSVASNGWRNLEVLDNLQGNWTTFNLCIRYMEASNLSDLPVIRLPTVTDFRLLDDEIGLPHTSLPAKFDFGKCIKHMTTPFQTTSHFLSEYHRSQNVLDNLTTLKIIFPRILEIEEEADLDMKIFTKEFPHLKHFELRFNRFEMMARFSTAHLKHFDLLTESIPFGEFDILNYESIEPLVKKLSNTAFRKKGRKLSKKKAKEIRQYIKNLSNSTAESDMYYLFVQFFKLQMESFSTYQGSFDKKYYLIARAFLSVVFLQLLQYAPNLETLNLVGVPLTEEYAAFHRLIKYHKKLKTVFGIIRSLPRHTDTIFVGIEGMELWENYYAFIDYLDVSISDSQLFISPDGFTKYKNFEAVKIDVYGFKNYLDTFHLRYSNDQRMDCIMPPSYKFGTANCAFLETIPLDNTELTGYNHMREYHVSPWSRFD